MPTCITFEVLVVNRSANEPPHHPNPINGGGWEINKINRNNSKIARSASSPSSCSYSRGTSSKTRLFHCRWWFSNQLSRTQNHSTTSIIPTHFQCYIRFSFMFAQFDSALLRSAPILFAVSTIYDNIHQHSTACVRWGHSLAMSQNKLIILAHPNKQK